MSKVLFWDFDGTLVHDNEAFPHALQQALREKGNDIPMEEVEIFIRRTNSRYFPEVSYTDKTGPLWWKTLFEHTDRFMETHQIDEAHWAEINAAFKRRVLGYSYTVYADAEETLVRCREMGYQNYVISNNYPELPEVIRSLGLAGYFVDYFVSANVGYEKPRQELFQIALRGAGVPDISYMIGDNPMADVKGAKACGIKTILVHSQCDSDADYRCQNLGEIPEFLRLN